MYLFIHQLFIERLLDIRLGGEQETVPVPMDW